MKFHKVLGFSCNTAPCERGFSITLADETICKAERIVLLCLEHVKLGFSGRLSSRRSYRKGAGKQEGYGVNVLYRQGQLKKALEVLYQMDRRDSRAVSVAYVNLLRECGKMKCLEHGKQVHAQIMECGLESDIFVASTLVSIYGKCGSLSAARKVFEKMPERNSVSWNAMISGYARTGDGEEALRLCEEMKSTGLKPDRVTFICIINACASISALKQGLQVHAAVLEAGFELDVVVATALVDMYSKCGSLLDARKVFDGMPDRNLISWNAMITGYAKHGKSKEALLLYHQMKAARFKPDGVTYVSILHACAGSLDLEKGKAVHADILEGGCKLDVFVGNALIDMYAKCGYLVHARQVFEQMPYRDVITWTTLIGGYGKLGRSAEAIQLFKRMKQDVVQPNEVTFLCILDACASLAALEEGQRVHAEVIKSGFESDVVVGTALVDMYAKCGNLKSASEVFYRMPVRNVVSWNAMIAGSAKHGNADGVFKLFGEMLQENIVPNKTTFVSILSLCSHLGLLDRGRHFYEAMKHDYNLEPSFEHYGCMVDLYGRAGQLEEANILMKEMSKTPDISQLKALLSACRIYGNVALAETIMKLLLQFEPQNAAAYVLLSNTYAAIGMKAENSELRRVMEDRGVRKQPGRCWF
ncbi:hypothetical protein O6H91_13G071000 [Diphasiastrum complanatum]|uniref:Uncharacterized protein n=1 Tax=Diphasiastrum complanatum TaxID=34168 RepID=A0ACC2BW20_DIPCM|nr:hypothetical protein O6H91_13G071000 [Diphasiastrum complanatum]